MPDVVVRRGDFQRYEVLYKVFGDRVPVIWDRRHSERRRLDSLPDTSDRRRGKRRSVPPLSWLALGVVIVER